MLSGSHLDIHTAVQSQAEVAGTGLQRLVPVPSPPSSLGEDAVVDIVATAAGVREQGEESKRRAPSCSGIVHLAEAGDVGTISREATLVTLGIRVRHGFGLRGSLALSRFVRQYVFLSGLQ